MNISMLHCALVMRIFRIEGLYLIITRVVMFGHAFDHWRDLIFLLDLNNFFDECLFICPN